MMIIFLKLLNLIVNKLNSYTLKGELKMAEMFLYVVIEQKSEDEYCRINKEKIARDIEEIKEFYNTTIDIIQRYDKNAYITFDEYSRQFIPVTVKYDGRKRGVHVDDIKEVLCKKGIIKKVGHGGIMGDYYKVVDFSKVKNGCYIGETLSKSE